MSKKKKGFTLVELLAVIVILAIILAIAIPSITGVISTTRKSAFESNVKLIIKGVQYKLLEDPTGITTGDNLANITDFGGDPAQYSTFSITSLDPVTVSLTAAAGGKFDGWQVTDATYTNVDVTAIP